MRPAPERRMLLDTAALYFRAFYAVPDTVRAPNGTPVNAVRGLLDIIARLVSEFRPTELVACWDDDWRPQWRVDLLSSYKAHRVAGPLPTDAGAVTTEQVPDLLIPQVPIIRDVLGTLGVPIVGAADHEADDVIGTLASHSPISVDVVTGDRDLFQLIDDSRDLRVIYTGRGMSRLEILTDVTLKAKYGITPAQYADFATLRGDPSDGLPGVAGVGEKSAVALLSSYGDLDGIVSAASDPGSGMAPAVRARVAAAADYLRRAPAVVKVVRDLALPDFDGRIRPRTSEQEADQARMSADWGLGSSMKRVHEALAAAG